MEPEKRKLKDDGETKVKRTKRKGVNGGQTAVTDEEVDEFFAILRRIHAIKAYFETGKVGGSKLTANTWRPSFEPEDFIEHNDVKDRDDGDSNSNSNEGKKQEAEEEEESGLDLNIDPGST